MGLFNGNEMRGMMTQSYEDTRMNKSRELNETMSIDTQKSEDQYGQQVHSLSRSTFSDDERTNELDV